MTMDPLTAGLEIGGKILDHFFPDPVKKAEAMLELQKMQQAGDLAIVGYQSDINKVEAASADPFTSRWRPFIGWICGCGLAIQFIVSPVVEWAAALAGHPTLMPKLDTGTLTTLLIGMLGLGGMRTMEKLSNAQGNH